MLMQRGFSCMMRFIMCYSAIQPQNCCSGIGSFITIKDLSTVHPNLLTDLHFSNLLILVIFIHTFWQCDLEMTCYLYIIKTCCLVFCCSGCWQKADRYGSQYLLSPCVEEEWLDRPVNILLIKVCSGEVFITWPPCLTVSCGVTSSISQTQGLHRFST